MYNKSMKVCFALRLDNFQPQGKAYLRSSIALECNQVYIIDTNMTNER